MTLLQRLTSFRVGGSPKKTPEPPDNTKPLADRTHSEVNKKVASYIQENEHSTNYENYGFQGDSSKNEGNGNDMSGETCAEHNELTKAQNKTSGVEDKVKGNKKSLFHRQLSCPEDHHDSVCAYHHGGFVNEGFLPEDNSVACKVNCAHEHVNTSTHVCAKADKQENGTARNSVTKKSLKSSKALSQNSVDSGWEAKDGFNPKKKKAPARPKIGREPRSQDDESESVQKTFSDSAGAAAAAAADSQRDRPGKSRLVSVQKETGNGREEGCGTVLNLKAKDSASQPRKASPARPTFLQLPQTLSGKSSLSSAVSESSCAEDDGSSSRVESGADTDDTMPRPWKCSSSSCEEPGPSNLHRYRTAYDLHTEESTANLRVPANDQLYSDSDASVFQAPVAYSKSHLHVPVSLDSVYADSENSEQLRKADGGNVDDSEAVKRKTSSLSSLSGRRLMMNSNSELDDSEVHDVSDSDPQFQPYTLKARTCGDRTVWWSTAKKSNRKLKIKTRFSSIDANNQQTTHVDCSLPGDWVHEKPDQTQCGESKFPETYRSRLDEEETQSFRVHNNKVKVLSTPNLTKVKGNTSVAPQSKPDVGIRYSPNGKRVPPKKPKRKKPPANASAAKLAPENLTSDTMTSLGRHDVRDVVNTTQKSGDVTELGAAHELPCVEENSIVSASKNSASDLSMLTSPMTRHDVDNKDTNAMTLCTPPESFRDRDCDDFETIDEINGSLV
jgi:hypothetical protein